MATRTMSATSNGNSGDLKSGASWTYSASNSADSAVYNYSSINSATLYISSIKAYTTKTWYLDVYVGGTKVAETVEISDSNSSAHSATYNLEYLEPELMTASGNIKLTVHNNGSNSVKTCNFRTGTAKITVNYSAEVTPTAPTINIPIANTTTYNTKPWFNFKANADTKKLYWRVDSGTWQNFNASNGTSYAKQWTTALSTGSHTVYCYAQSSTSTNSSTVSRAFIIGTPQAAVKAGDLFDDATIDGLQTNINNVRKYYNLGTYTFTTCNDGTLALDDHIDQLETALSACPHFSDIANVDAGNSIAIANVNNVRTALLNS